MTLMSDDNNAYKQKFGFPFIIAVRMHTKEGIFFGFSRRLKNDTQTEYANDLQNVYAITRLRLAKMLEESCPSRTGADRRPPSLPSTFRQPSTFTSISCMPRACGRQ